MSAGGLELLAAGLLGGPLPGGAEGAGVVRANPPLRLALGPIASMFDYDES